MLLETAAGRAPRAQRVLLATNAYRPLVRSIQRYVVPVYDYVLVTEPLSDEQRRAVGWERGQGVADSGNRFHYYRLTPAERAVGADGARILWGGYEAIYHFRNGMRPELEDHAPTFELLASNFAATFPQLEGIRFTHRWAGAIDTCSRFCVTFGTRPRRARGVRRGYTGLGVVASRFGARVALDLLHGRDTELTRLADGPQPADPVPARAAPLRRDPDHPPRARPGRRARRQARPVAARPRPDRCGLRQLGRRPASPTTSVQGLMAEYRPKHRGLERVLGTGALFSTAYGNVGSSIYYALGLVAIYAAGMTPVVFVIAGLIFAATAATYAEATTMYPEAGGSSSFARRAFNEFWSFFAAWGQMLTYIITIAISAFFVPHYLGVFWSPLGESPADIFGGIVVVVLLGHAEHRRRQGVGRREHRLRRRRLPHPGPAGDRRHRAGVRPGAARASRWTSARCPTVGDFLIAIPVAMVAYTGIETISNMAEEARDYGKTIPRGIGLVVGAVAVIYTFLPAVALSAMPVVNGVDDPRAAEGGGRLRGRPGARRRREHGPRLARSTPAEIYVGILAATILFIATNAGILGVSRLSYSMGQHRQLPEFLRVLHPRFRTPYIAITRVQRDRLHRDRARARRTSSA